ncbi:MAG TPA: MlaD family protein [Flavobacteriales bacterium]|jgi:phospholipid/cholesterol/gamma-HCH transport system substrate-binding protein|nr:MlaD family protein [Flavobacteriales bacterium]
MKKISKEIKIGILVVTSIVLLVWGTNYLKGSNLFDSSKTFYALYDRIGGLQEGSGVMVSGFKVGFVKKIQLLSEDNYKLLVVISINNDIKIPENSVLKIVNEDIMGTKGVALQLGNSKEFLAKGDTLATDMETSLKEEVNLQVLPLKNKAEELIGSIDSVVTVITSVLSKDARESLTKSLVSLDNTFTTMSQTMTKVNKIVDQNDERISSIIENLEANNDEITNILKNFSDLSDDIAKSNIKTTLASLNEISKKISDSEGSLGMFINDKDLYLNLEKSSKELETLIKDIKLNPKRYVGFSVLGGKSKSYKRP